MPNLTVNYVGSPYVLAQIAEGGYSSEYLKRESTFEFRVKIRHTKEKAVAGQQPLDRHNLELTLRTYPTDALPLGSTETAYVVIRTNPDSDGVTAVRVLTALTDLVTTHGADIVAWQSTL